MSGCKRCSALALILVLGLWGCDEGYTIHSIYQASPGTSSVPDVTGLWQLSDPGWPGSVLQIAAKDYDVGHCRLADIRRLDMRSNEEDRVIGDEMCFVPIARHMVMQVRTTGEVSLYQDFLVKIDHESISTCGSIWTLLMVLTRDHPARFSMEGLKYTIRSDLPRGNEMIVTSPTDELRAYLEVNLPKIARMCDQGDEEGPHWVTLKRLTPARLDEDAGGSSPSP